MTEKERGEARVYKREEEREREIRKPKTNNERKKKKNGERTRGLEIEKYIIVQAR